MKVARALIDYEAINGFCVKIFDNNSVYLGWIIQTNQVKMKKEKEIRRRKKEKEEEKLDTKIYYSRELSAYQQIAITLLGWRVQR